MAAFKCTCGSTFQDQHGLQQHIKAKNKDKSLVCSCRTRFPNRNALVAHAQKHGHLIMHEDDGGKLSATEDLNQRDLQCPHCPKKKPFDSEEALQQHTEALHSKTPEPQDAAESMPALREQVLSNCERCYGSSEGRAPPISDR